MKSSARPFLALGLLVAVLAAGCAKDGKDVQEPMAPPPRITSTMKLDDALKAAVDYGGDTMTEVRKLLRKRKEFDKAGPIVRVAILDGIEDSQNHQLMNAAAFYMMTPEPPPVEMLEKMIGSGRPLAAQLGWQIAAIKPSKTVAATLDQILSRALKENDEDTIMLPQMANAVASNRLTSAYTMVRRGLMMRGDEEFAQAMIGLDADRASKDFLPYLAQANVEELRQLTLGSVNVYSVITILKHMLRFPADIGAPGVDHLFAYAVSRNVALAELAQQVLEAYVPKNTELLAQGLARHPLWVQIAYIEGARRKMTPKVGLLVTELKKSTSEEDVIAEIDELKF